MNVAVVADLLQLTVAGSTEDLTRTVSGGYVGDLLSDVMANSKPGQLWITRQAHQNIIAVAALKDLSGIVLALGREPDLETVDHARNEHIPLLISKRSAFDVAGELYALLSDENETDDRRKGKSG